MKLPVCPMLTLSFQLVCATLDGMCSVVRPVTGVSTDIGFVMGWMTVLLLKTNLQQDAVSTNYLA